MSAGAGAAGPTHGCGDHLCWTYADEAERRATLASYFLEGVAAGEKLAYFGSSGTEQAIVDYLGENADVDGLLRSGRLVVDSAENAYMPGGRFDPDARVLAYERFVLDALTEGYPGVRVFGDTGWVPTELGDLQPWLTYELRAELLASRLPFVALCGYDLRRWDTDAVALADAVHRSAPRGTPRLSPFRIHGSTGGTVVITGELDHFNADHLRELLRSAARAGDHPVIDVRGVRFVGAAAAGAIFDAVTSLPGARIVGAPPVLRRVWELLGYGEVVALDGGNLQVGGR